MVRDAVLHLLFFYLCPVSNENIMKKIKILSLFVGLLAILSACGDDDDTPIPVTVKTVLMYLVADNSISGDIYSNIASVEEGLIKATSPGTFVIYWDGGSRKSEFPDPTLFKYEVDGKGKVSKREVIKTYSSQNSVSNEVINRVLKDVEAYCPAEKYSLIFGSHATGWLPVDDSKSRSFGDDSGAKINIPDLSVALKQSGIHFDYILFDACLMSQVEAAYELRNVADYLILSPTEVWDKGFPYFKMVKYLLAADNAQQNAINVAKDYVDFYKNECTERIPWATIAVIKTDEMQALASITHSIMGQYQGNLTRFDSNKINYFQTNYGYGRSPLNYSTYDFGAFVRELTSNNIPPAFEEQLSKVIVYKDYVDDAGFVNIDPEVYSGIGCYIPYESFSKWNAYFKNLQWYSAAGWNETGW